MVVNLILESLFSSYKQDSRQAITSLVGDKNLKESKDQLLVTESAATQFLETFLSISGSDGIGNSHTKHHLGGCELQPM